MKIDTSTDAGGAVAVARMGFDRHIDACAECKSGRMCHLAQAMWRVVCKVAVKAAVRGDA